VQKALSTFAGLFVVAMSIASCGSRENDPFFDAEYDSWPDNARELPTQRIYELYKKQLQMPPPSEPTLATPLGERGRAAVDLMIGDLDRGDQTILGGYYTLLSETNLRSGFDFCTTGDYYFRINRGLERATGFQYPKDLRYRGGQGNAFDQLCYRIISSPLPNRMQQVSE
jgi:hypothetical protein